MKIVNKCAMILMITMMITIMTTVILICCKQQEFITFLYRY
jgi:hypothetical protein